jgi:hypothetical protein
MFDKHLKGGNTENLGSICHGFYAIGIILKICNWAWIRSYLPIITFKPISQ